MKLTAEDFKRQYRAMSDEELLAMDPDELQDIARKCYQAEVTRRQLAEPPEELTEDEEPDEPRAILTAAPTSKLVPVATFVSMEAAEPAYTALKQANVAVFVEETPEGLSLMVPWPLHQAAYIALNDLEEGSAELVQQWLQKALPGRSIMIEDMLAEDDLVAARLTVDGSHQVFCFARVADGKIAQMWHNLDQLD
jgi:hypothetical protein